ncbi:hypothetical protein CYMTET_11918 [Cymbomonas tetramitiformis]|uniref:protein-serine/threonine phosphatase n=1 Tax=Cymbomonas tetramitiformis TaxID=36881 RepID=A0AAE0LCZ7_9CHLO|nr:hypothetical protein CYMTET_11918 [Cymbomonas tetramitiformis]
MGNKLCCGGERPETDEFDDVVTSPPSKNTNDPKRKRASITSVPGAQTDASDEQETGHKGSVSSPPGGNNSALNYSYECAVMPGFDPEDEEESKECQDSGLILETLASMENMALAAVFDGHGQNGRKASQWVRTHLPKFVHKQITAGATYEAALAYGCCEAEKGLMKQSFNVKLSGTTATICLLEANKLHCSWVGDSRAVMAQRTSEGKLEVVDLSIDHKPEDPEERKRIERKGGIVKIVPGDDTETYRVFDKIAVEMGQWRPGLAMARSVGDTSATDIGCIPVPTYAVFDLTPKDEFVIIASDGLWEVFTSQQSIEWAEDYMKSHREADDELPGHGKNPKYLTCSEAMAQEAQKRWVVVYNKEIMVDDCTVLFCWLDKNTSAEEGAEGPTTPKKKNVRRATVMIDQSDMDHAARVARVNKKIADEAK